MTPSLHDLGHAAHGRRDYRHADGECLDGRVREVLPGARQQGRLRAGDDRQRLRREAATRGTRSGPRRPSRARALRATPDPGRRRPRPAWRPGTRAIAAIATSSAFARVSRPTNTNVPGSRRTATTSMSGAGFGSTETRERSRPHVSGDRGKIGARDDDRAGAAQRLRARPLQRLDLAPAGLLELLECPVEETVAARTLVGRVGDELRHERRPRHRGGEARGGVRRGRVDEICRPRPARCSRVRGARSAPESGDARETTTTSHGRHRRLAVAHRDDDDLVSALDEEPRELRPVCRGSTDIRRPDAREEDDAHERDGAVDRGRCAESTYHRRPRWATCVRARSREARDPAFALLLAAIAVSLIKAVDQPGLSVALAAPPCGSFSATCCWLRSSSRSPLRVARTRAYPRQRSRLDRCGARVRRADPCDRTRQRRHGVRRSREARLAARALLVGCVVLIDSTDRLWVVVLLIVVVTAAAVVWGLVGFAQNPGSRQASFLGEHDLAALSTACLVVGLAALHCRHRLSPLAARRGGRRVRRDRARRGSREPARPLPGDRGVDRDRCRCGGRCAFARS